MNFTKYYFNLGYNLQKEALLKKDVTLQPHQQGVLDQLSESELKSLLMYHGLGSGKTLSAITATSDTPTDFVVPASLRENAKKELQKFTKKHKSNVRSYEHYRKHGPTDKATSLVLDEAHKISNPDTQAAKALLASAKKYSTKLLLTGSPIKNHPYDLMPLLGVLNPAEKIPSREKFNEAFIKTEQVDPGFWAKLKGATPGEVETIKNKDKFQEMWKGKVNYYQGSNDDYPDVTEKNVSVVMSPIQQKLYKKTTEDIPYSVRVKMEKGIPLSKSEKAHINSYFSASRQISNSVRNYGEQDSTPKIDKMVKDIQKTLKKHPTGKTVTYSNYLNSGVNEIATELEKKGIPYGVFNGKLTDKKRKELINQFNDNKIRSLLVSGAGSEGLDLKGTRLMQIMEPHWNEARTDQMKGRAIRYKSHSHLPKKDQHVEVRNYMSVLPDGFFGTEPPLSTDQYMQQLGEKKTNLNEQFLRVLRMAGSKAIKKVNTNY